AELQVLLTIHGAPLVLKLDNGAAFRSGWLKRCLRVWGVWPLYSPPGQPWYNGAIEASIGSLKKRTAWQAWRVGHEGEWSGADLGRCGPDAGGGVVGTAAGEPVGAGVVRGGGAAVGSGSPRGGGPSGRGGVGTVRPSRAPSGSADVSTGGARVTFVDEEAN